MSTESKFTVDLGAIKMTDDQHHRMNAAIQKAVAGELANVVSSGKIVLIPVRKWGKGPIIDGIIARPINDLVLKQVLGH